MGLGDIISPEKFNFYVIYNGVVLFVRKARITPAVSWFWKKSRVGYLIPPELVPIRQGKKHIVIYHQNNSVPLADLMDIIPDQIRQIEPKIADAVMKGIDQKVEEMTQRGEMMSESEADLYTKVSLWMQRYQGTALIYQLWRWGYFKGEKWYRGLSNADRDAIDRVVFPEKISLVGMRPMYLYEREKSTMVPDILRRQESKWGWLADILPALIIGAGLVLIGIYLLQHGV